MPTRMLPDRAIAVFGSADPQDGDPLYRQAYRTGALLAARGLAVITGGYGGVMEGACRGAAEAGGRTIGVTASIFDERAPNPYLDEIVHSDNLHDRTRELIDRASGYIVLRGRAGTLAELAQLWALNRAGCLERRPVVLLGDGWGAILESMIRNDILETAQLEVTSVAKDEEEAVDNLMRGL